jgi:hypothetical protein
MSAVCTRWGRSWRLMPLVLGTACAIDWDAQVAEGVERQRAEVDAGEGAELNGDEVETSQVTASSPDAQPDEVDTNAMLPPSDVHLWFSADHGLTVDARGRVQAWTDRSGQRLSAVAESEELAPIVQRHGDLPLVAFDGAQELRLPAVGPLGVLSFFAVVDVAVEDRKCPSILHLSNSEDGVIQIEDLEFGRHQRELYYESGSKSVPQGTMHTGSFSSGALHVLAVRHEPTTLAVTRVDGADVHARMMELPETVTRGSNYIGHNHYFYNGAPSCDGFMGRIAEIILYARLLDDSERAQVEQYLSDKWDVPLQIAP